MMNASKVRLTISYSALWIVHFIATFIVFPPLNFSCVILGILIVGIGAWAFGTTVGLIATLITLAHNFILTGIVFTDHIELNQYTLTGYILLPTITYILGHLRMSFTALKEPSCNLDRMVAPRRKILSNLTSMLLENSENLKIARGQELHDGIGQHGIQLMSTSISEQLLTEKNEKSEPFSIDFTTMDKQKLIISISKATTNRGSKRKPLITDYRLKLASGSIKEFIRCSQTTSEFTFPLLAVT